MDNKEKNTVNNSKVVSFGTKSSAQNNLVFKVNAMISNTASLQQNFMSVSEQKHTFNINDIVNELLNIGKIDNQNELYNKVYEIISKNINSNFLAIGLFKEKSACINLRLQDKLGNIYSTKIFNKEQDNPIIKAFTTKEMQFTESNNYLNIAYIRNYSTIILPLISLNKCIGVFVIEDKCARQNIQAYSLITTYLALVIHNFELLETSEGFVNTDSLTLLYNHRGFQDILTNEISRAKTNKQSLSVLMMDVNNITKINRELGHAKGDEVIKTVAEKIRQNLRTNDIAGRYGGDEIAIILPNTDSAQAKYVAEYLTYSLSCCFIDDIGPIKVSVGVSTYPDCADDKEKLLVLAEQAMYISQAKGYKDGMSAIISSSDFNFWDDMALNSYAEVIAKRHSELGVNFEEELINRFHSEPGVSEARIGEVAKSLAGAIDAKDPYTKGHSTSVSKFSEALARAINLPEKEIERISLGALLHDVGKIGIPEKVLHKEGPLSDDEWAIMKQHPSIGVEKVLQPNSSLRDLIPIVKYHHERIDGKGYPDGISGSEIPLAAKIVAIADTYHALVSDRPYRKGMAIEKAIAILESGAGTQWDSSLVRTFIKIAPSLGM